ncbi:NADPH-dependent FMN reductase [Rhizobium leguminosarum]|uniref:NADPH-dependent FMN reductase n=1 Tax=Rhizobium leguminosarum TaxID=384 RepID=UPI0013E9666B|nr:NAD(P)H-dependent oxidoreductase [Rhizobium leguminosarum]
MQIVIIAGSQRPGSQSRRLAEQIQGRSASRRPDVEARIVSLVDAKVPMWDPEFMSDSDLWRDSFGGIERKFRSASGFIFVVPEYGGMAPPILKNLFLLDRNHIFAHKPALIVAISEGLGGAYPIAELRMSSYKNTRICWIPHHVIVRRVSQFTAATDEAPKANLPQAWTRIDHACDVLFAYSTALQGMRSSANVDLSLFPNGM